MAHKPQQYFNILNMRKLFFTIALFCGITSVTAQTTITDVIKSIPQELLPYINNDQRKEINAFTDERDSVEIKNALNGTTTVYTANGTFAQFNLNDITRLQIKLLPVNDTTQIICVAKTVTRPVADSDIKFYSTDWTPIDSDFDLPTSGSTDSILAAFTERPDTMSLTRYEELARNIEPVILSANVSESDDTITFNLSIPFTTKEESNNIKAIIRQKTFKWNGKSFKIC